MALTDDLISYWKLDEASGTREDSHGSNDLTDNNTVGSATGKINSGADFEAGSSEYLSEASVPSGTAWTWSLWINLESSPADYMTLVCHGALDAVGMVLFVNPSNKLAVYIESASIASDGAGSATFSTGTWYHVVHSYSPATGIQFWVNTVADVDTSHTGTPTTGNLALNLGREISGGGRRHFDGIIDEVGFWSRVLTSDERAELYNGGSGLGYPFEAGGGGSGALNRRRMGGVPFAFGNPPHSAGRMWG